MKKLIIFFCVHFIVIFIIQITLFVYSAFDRHIPVLEHLKSLMYESTFTHVYLMSTGINTGYGFYGIRVSTNKYFIIEAIDSKNKILKKIDVLNLANENSFGRFNTSTSYYYNFIIETGVLQDKDVNKKNTELILLRKKYIQKSLENIGKYFTKDIKNCAKYKVKIITVVPPNIWNTNLDKNNIYVLENYKFENK